MTTPLINELVNEMNTLLKEKLSLERHIGTWRLMEEDEPDGNIFPEILVRDIGFIPEDKSRRYVYFNNNWSFRSERADDDTWNKYKPTDFHIWKPYIYNEKLPSEAIIEKVKKGKTGGKPYTI